jgi:hypothetical protein
VKSSLISATSLVALLVAAFGTVHAAVINREFGSTNIPDPIQDLDMPSNDSPDLATRQELSVAAVSAFNFVSGGWRSATSTGQSDDAAAAGDAFPAIPLGAAPGTKPNNDFASAVTGSGQLDPVRKAWATGIAMIAPLIGTAGYRASVSDKAGGSVFIAAGGQVGFNAAGSGMRMESGNRFGPGSTGTATVTVPAVGRQSAAIVPYVATLKPEADAVSQPAPGPDAVQPVPRFKYAPVASSEAKTNLVPAEFSDSVTASGHFRNSARPPSSVSDDGKTAGLAQKLQGAYAGTEGDGTRTLLSASVGADPPVAAARHLASVIRSAPTSPPAQTVEAFQIGAPAGPKTQAVSDPLLGKIVAGNGALNNSLALP